MKENRLMSWIECKRNFIKMVELDNENIESIKKMAIERLDIVRNMKPSKGHSSFIVENYYEAIKELLVAYLLKNKMRSKNHQCLISYFYLKNPDYEKEAFLISQMSYFRNRLEYYGEKIPLDFYEINKAEFENIISILLKITD